jgi:hypothetical protein
MALHTCRNLLQPLCLIESTPLDPELEKMASTVHYQLVTTKSKRRNRGLSAKPAAEVLQHQAAVSGRSNDVETERSDEREKRHVDNA